MAKFTFKSLFIKETEQEEEIQVEKKDDLGKNNAFPETVPQLNYEKTPPISPPPPINIPQQQPVNQSIKNINGEVLNQVIEMYANGFDSLNKPGYDFFEFFKSITSIPEQSPQMYAMAFQMGKSMAPQISKQTLLTDAEFYIAQVNGVHSKFQSQGENKKQQLANATAQAKEAVLKEIANLEDKIKQLKAQILQLETYQLETNASLAPLEMKNAGEIQNIDQKLVANDYAREQIIAKIEMVKQGIQNYI